jgi:hypothetical protein
MKRTRRGGDGDGAVVKARVFSKILQEGICEGTSG